MAIKKSELYSSIWKSCDELRGGMDASQYKDYVLTLLFLKYVSDKYAGKKKAPIIIPEGASFADLAALKNKPGIGEKINTRIIGPIAEANGLVGIIDQTDFDNDDHLGSGKEMIDRLTNLIGIFENPALDFSGNREDDDDILGDAYEFLMRHFATESGKSKGQFYTPSEVSRVLAKLLGVKAAKESKQTVYDPTCGSGSLLLKVAGEAPVKLSIYGQEKDIATSALAVMNMWLHGYSTADIQKGNTISDPFWKENNRLKTFDFVVANPPFSSKNWSTGLIDEKTNTVVDPFNRFENFGIPPPKNGDYAFLLHIVASLNSTGKGAVILPHGVLFRGNAEAAIRKNLVQRGLLKGIIGLPANLFYGTGIPACIIIIDKENAAQRKGIFFIDAARGFIKDGNKNRLRDQDIHKIVDVFGRMADEAGYSRMVKLDEIEKNDFNLNIPRYIDSQEKEDAHDLSAHLLGGIPAADVDELQAYWNEFKGLKEKLFTPSKRKGYFEPLVAVAETRAVIQQDKGFARFREKRDALFEQWLAQNETVFGKAAKGLKPRAFIHTLSESLLDTFSNQPLTDAYAVYQELMDEWEQTMKDDAYLVSEDGWKATTEAVKDAKGKIRPGEWTCPLLPKPIAIARYFSKEQAALDALGQTAENAARELDELIEEHSGEDGLLTEALNDKGKISKPDLTARIRATQKDKDAAEEHRLLKKVQALIDTESEARKKKKLDEQFLDQQLFKKYGALSAAEVKDLVVNEKWLAALRRRLQQRTEAVAQQLGTRCATLAERYAQPLSAIETEVEALGKKVEQHLEKMGLAWN